LRRVQDRRRGRRHDGAHIGARADDLLQGRRQIVRIDLEGDGTAEVLLTGSFYKKGVMEAQTPGDYSFALLRKIVDGKARNILIEGEFFTKRDYYDPPNERRILAVADLNGDGRMEIVLDTFYYEGNWKRVLEIDGTKLTKVLEVSCLV
jgi:hypothetical protein